jgi:hypothetical protein
VEQGTATLAAAVIAAVAAFGTLLANTILGRKSEFRATHREALLPILPPLGQAVYEALAVSNLLIAQRVAGEARKNWLARGLRAGTELAGRR